MDMKSELQKATLSLASAGIPTSKLDAELLLAYVIKKQRSWIIAHSDERLDPSTQTSYRDVISKRLERQPVAYIIGSKEFYGREFVVTPDVLIPRPETEMFIKLARKYLGDQNSIGLDVGTGSGALGITLALELPNLKMSLTDIDQIALNIAKQNAERLGAPITSFIKSNLFESIGSDRYDLIVANLPYVDHSWERSPETDHEPGIALFATDNGLEIIKKCIQTVQGSLNHNGYLMLESDPTQQPEIIAYASHYSLTHIATADYVTVFRA